MPKVIRYCEGLMEASWLAALLCTPLFLSIWGEGLGCDKNYLLRSLTVVLLAAWGIKTVFAGIDKSKVAPSNLFPRLARTPLALPVLALALLWILSTLFSLSPWESFWGVYFNRMGSFTFLCGVIIFAAIASHLRSERQIDRIVSVAILTSIPICLYAIAQRYDIEPVLIIDRRQAWRVASTLGNPIFLAGYLIMILPLTLGRIIADCPVRKVDVRSDRLVRLSINTLTALLQIIAIIFTISRGPTVGMIASLFIMLLLLAAYFGKRWLIFVLAGSFIASLIGLWLLTHPIGIFRRWSERPEVVRLVATLNPQSGSSGRAIIWDKAVGTSHFSNVVQTTEGKPDIFARFRFLIGYGPETVPTVSRLVRSPAYNVFNNGNSAMDRFHNDFWDTLVTLGILGLAAYVAVTFLIVYFACLWLGFIPNRREKIIFWSCLVGAGFIGSLLFALAFGTGFLGLGLRLGTLAGLTVFLLWKLWLSDVDRNAGMPPRPRALLLMALLSGLVAHLTEIAFAFPTETTLVYFWAYVAVLFVIGHRPPASSSETSPKPSKKQLSASKAKMAAKPAIAGGLIMTLLLANLGFMLLRQSRGQSAVDTILTAIIRLPDQLPENQKGPTFIVLFGIIATVVLFAMAWTAEGAGGRVSFRPIGVSLAVSGLFGLAYWLLLAGHTSAMLLPSGASFVNLRSFIRDYTFLIDFHYAFVLLVLLCMAWSLADRPMELAAQRKRSSFANAAAALLALGAMALIYVTNMKWSKVGVMDNLAGHLTRREKWPLAAAVCETAIKLAPATEHHYVELGRAQIEIATAASSEAERQEAFLKADRVLEAGQRVNPFDTRFPTERGNVYLKWATASSSPERKKELGKKAIEYFKQAIRVDPDYFQLKNTMAYAYLDCLGALDDAHNTLLQSLTCYPQSDGTFYLLGDVLNQKGLAAADRAVREAFFQSAATNFNQALTLASKNAEDADLRYLYATSLGKARLSVGDWRQALNAYEIALANAPPAERWKIEESLARIFADTKDYKAVIHIARAIELAPPESRPGLLELQNKIRAIPEISKE